MKKKPNKTQINPKVRDERGRFVAGNPATGGGRPEGSGISITTEIKKELAKCPEGKNKATYLSLLIKRILKKAIVEGDSQMIKNIWNYIDGMPKQNMELSGKVELPQPILEIKSNAILQDNSDPKNNNSNKKD